MYAKVLQFPNPAPKLPTTKDELVDHLIDDLLGCIYIDAAAPHVVTRSLVVAVEAAWDAGFRAASNQDPAQ